MFTEEDSGHISGKFHCSIFFYKVTDIKSCERETNRRNIISLSVSQQPTRHSDTLLASGYFDHYIFNDLN